LLPVIGSVFAQLKKIKAEASKTTILVNFLKKPH
jgi:hypothetical protein